MKFKLAFTSAAMAATLTLSASAFAQTKWDLPSAYAASKHGVVGLTRTAALEYAKKGIRINALCPGFTLTPMVQSMFDAGLSEHELTARVPLGRLGTASEMADTVLYLCSSASAFMVGHALAVDGGLHAG